MAETSSGAVCGDPDRRRWMGLLARGPAARLEEAWAGLAQKPRFGHLRAAESGLVMLRGRAGGTGRRFNLGEMTMSRCAVRLDDGTVGLGYVAGRARRHAELAALFDALLQDGDRRAALEESLLTPLAREQAARREAAARKAGATKVEFFTMVRGED